MKIKTILQSEAGTLVVLKMIIALLLFSSCTEDASLQDKDMDYKSRGLIIRVPNGYSSNFDTKAGEEENEENSSAEGGIKNLWMFAFPVDNNGEIFIKQLIGYNELNVTDSEEDEVYKKYEITDIKDGTYHFYFLANLDDYLDKNSKDYLSANSDASEEDIKGLILNYTESTNKAKKIVAGNLPMACIYNEVKVREGGTKIIKSEIPISKASMTEIFADLTFLCSKVRYTILFDKTDRGFSNSFSDSNIDFEIPYATSIKSKTDVTPETLKYEVEYLSQTNLELEHVNIPNNYEKGSSIENLIFEAGTWEEQDVKKAWQGIVYLPENIQSSDNNEKKTKIIFPAKGTNVTDEYELTLLSSTYKDLNNDSDPDWSGIKRGHFYDIVITMENPYNRELEYEVKVENWDLQPLNYNINGPTDLTVDQTKIKVEAGITSELNYQTSFGGKVWCESPKYTFEDGSQIDFYSFVIKNGVVEININEDIPIGLTEEELKEYSYFHICAGNLRKKIEVSPLVFTPYLKVSPELINLSVQQFIASGQYAGSIPIVFSTNVSGLTMKAEKIDGSQIQSNNDIFVFDDKALKLTGDANNKKSGTLSLDFSDLNQGLTFWKNENSYKLTFSVSYQEGGNTKTIIREIIIKVQPYTTDYIIHFRSSDNSWNNPHVFIYQPLELPTDIIGPDGNLSQFAGWPVGYEDKDQPGKIHPCYEYIFTMGIVFKGWFGYGGPNENNPKVSTTQTEGFAYGWIGENKYWVFHDSNGGRTYYNDNNSENRRLSDSKFFREVHTNFNHEKNFTNVNKVCGYCTALNLRPGICMFKEEFEGETWWTYILTGVATPGKAKILFSQGHGPHPDDNNRNEYPWTAHYPEDEYEGVPLFDFPDNEGWFLYDVNNKKGEFTDNRP